MPKRSCSVKESSNKRVKGVRVDPNISKEEDLRCALSKNCGCAKMNHIASLKEWLGENLQTRMQDMMQIFHNLNTGTNSDRIAKLYNYLLSMSVDGKVTYQVLGQPLCYNSFAILFASSNLLSKILPAIKSGTSLSSTNKSSLNRSTEEKFDSFFNESEVVQHFRGFFDAVLNNCLIESSPIDGVQWLPTCFSVQEMYDSYVDDAKQLDLKYYCEKTFKKKWHTEYPNLKVREDSLRCDVCQLIENKLASCTSSCLAEQSRKHFNTIKNQCKSKENCLLLCGDGGDHIGLPRWRVTPKCMMARPTLPVSCYMIRRYIRTEDTSLNDFVKAYYYCPDIIGDEKLPALVVDCFRSALEEEGLEEGKLSNYHVFTCGDNAGKETKNKTFIAFLHNLVASGKIKQATYFNLLVGHTHFEVDQAIGRDKGFLRSKDIRTPDELITRLNRGSRSSASIPNYRAQYLDSICCWRKELCAQYGVLKGISSYARISIEKVQGEVKVFGSEGWNNATDPFEELETDFGVDSITDTIYAYPVEARSTNPKLLQNIPMILNQLTDEEHKTWWQELAHNATKSKENRSDENVASTDIVGGPNDEELLLADFMASQNQPSQDE